MAKRKTSKLPKWSELESDEILSIYPDAFLECRIGHDWTRRPIWNLVSTRPKVWEKVVGCRRCTATKASLVDDKTKQQVRAPYTKYPTGYLTPRTGLTRSDFDTNFNVRDFDRAMKDGRVHHTLVEDEEGTVGD